MSEGRECPMCTETMRLEEREVATGSSGTSETVTIKFNEWVCPECSYFEDADESESN